MTGCGRQSGAWEVSMQRKRGHANGCGGGSGISFQRRTSPVHQVKSPTLVRASLSSSMVLHGAMRTTVDRPTPFLPIKKEYGFTPHSQMCRWSQTLKFLPKCRGKDSSMLLPAVLETWARYVVDIVCCLWLSGCGPGSTSSTRHLRLTCMRLSAWSWWSSSPGRSASISELLTVSTTAEKILARALTISFTHNAGTVYDAGMSNAAARIPFSLFLRWPLKRWGAQLLAYSILSPSTSCTLFPEFV